MVRKILVFLAAGFIFIPGFLICGKAPVNAGPPPSPYRIGAGDVLDIKVWKEPDLAEEVVVLHDGRISYPLIGDVQAEGLTLADLRKVISEKMTKFIEVPEVSVMLKESASRRIFTLGKLKNPGPYPLEPGMTVLQALSAAGGFDEWADTKNIRIIRRQGDTETQMAFNYNQFIDGKNPEQNILLMPRDTIVVP